MEKELLKERMFIGGAGLSTFGTGAKFGESLALEGWDGFNFGIPEIMVTSGLLLMLASCVGVTRTDNGKVVW